MGSVNIYDPANDRLVPIVDTMVGASGSTVGIGGLVPTPQIGDDDKVLKGDGTWGEAAADDNFVGTTVEWEALSLAERAKYRTVDFTDDFIHGDVPVMTGATASADGDSGLAPKPVAGDQNKLLTGGATWKSSDQLGLQTQVLASTMTIGGQTVTEVEEALNALNENSGSGGHTIVDESGTELPTRSKLKFEGCDVSDDSTNDTTIIKAEGGEVIDYADFEQLTPEEQATGDYFIPDAPIGGSILPMGGMDSAPTQGSAKPVESHGIWFEFDKIKEQNTYSTTETWTGKYWIDGKKIYAKVITGLNISFSSGATYIDYDNTTISSLFGGIVKRSATSSFSEVGAPVGIQKNGTTKLTLLTVANFDHVDTLIFEYTKTTD